MTQTGPSRPRRVDAAVTQAGEHWILVPAQAGAEVVVVNGPGRAVFEHCDGAHTRADLARLFTGAGGEPPEEAHEDLGAFLDRLAHAGLLHGP